MGITLEDFYKILIDFVKFYPDGGCRSPQTFRAFQLGGGDIELGSPSLGAISADRDAYFYSKLWAQKSHSPNALAFNFPVVGVLQVQTNAQNPFQKSQTICESLEIMVLDKLAEDCGKQKGCAGRNVSQIFADTKAVLSELLYFVGGLVTATTTADPVEKIYHKDLGPTLPGFSIKKHIGATVAGKNTKAFFGRVEKHALKIYGISAVVDICFSECIESPIDFELPQNQNILSFESGCQNCN